MGIHEAFWQPGTHITVQNIWHGRVFSAFPFVVVEETAELIVTYPPPGTVWKRPIDLAGRDIRLPHGTWRLRDDVWYGHGTLRIFVSGAAHSVMVFLMPGNVDRWYINLEEPYQRTAIGLDTRDNHLDVVFPGDLSTPRWKDEAELEEAVTLGVVKAAEVVAIRAEAERASSWVQRGHPAINDRWRGWVPPDAWKMPQLGPGWDAVF
jgi:Protein of unknown function (DUF402)